jgi:GAF domain-containing protein
MTRSPSPSMATSRIGGPMLRESLLARTLVELADTLVDDFDVVDFLVSLSEHAALVSGADAVGLVLADHRGELQFMAASNEAARTLEMIQLESGEGPCVDCFRSKEPVVNGDLGSAGDMWPQFAPTAMAMGFQSVHAFPMRLRDQVIGALNLFSLSHSRLDPTDVRVVQSLADVATIAILQERSISRAEALTEQLQGALNSRIVIEQAKGALARIEGISVDEAFTRLRHRARSSRRRLADVAAEVLGEG